MGEFSFLFPSEPIFVFERTHIYLTSIQLGIISYSYLCLNWNWLFLPYIDPITIRELYRHPYQSVESCLKEPWSGIGRPFSKGHFSVLQMSKSSLKEPWSGILKSGRVLEDLSQKLGARHFCNCTNHCMQLCSKVQVLLFNQKCNCAQLLKSTSTFLQPKMQLC